jgi:hypothetical protein
MNNWIGWVIPLIGLAVWILSNLIKNQQDEARRKAARPKLDNADNPDIANAQRREAPPMREEIIRPRRVERARPVLRGQVVPVDRPRAEPVRPLRRPSFIQQIESAAIPQAIVVVPAPPPTPAEPAAPRATSRAPSKAVQSIHALLKDRKMVAAAIVLKEVLGPPLCKK